MTEVLSKALEVYKRQRFLEALNADFAALRQAPEVWSAEQAERAEWNATLSNDLF